MEKYSSVLAFSRAKVDRVFDEFVEYSLLEDSSFPQSVWDSAKKTVEDETFIRMDVIWVFLSNMKTPDGCALQFPCLSKVCRLTTLKRYYHTQTQPRKGCLA